MPELPEIEAARLAIQRVAVGRRITAVRCADDPIVFEGAWPAGIRRALLGRRVLAVRRHGAPLARGAHHRLGARRTALILGTAVSRGVPALDVARAAGAGNTNWAKIV